MIQDYSTLQQGIADWLARADLTTQIPTFIALAEARINRELRTRQMQTTTTGALSSNELTLPDDFRGVQSFRLSYGGTYNEVFPLAPEALEQTLATGFPSGYVIVNGVLKTIGGSGSEDYALTYWTAVPALSDSATTNWLLTREPGLYLYGALIEASPYLMDDARALIWSAQFKSILDGMAVEDDSARYGNAPQMRQVSFNAP